MRMRMIWKNRDRLGVHGSLINLPVCRLNTSQAQQEIHDKTTAVLISVENIKGEKTSLLCPHSSRERIPTTTGRPIGPISYITPGKVCSHMLAYPPIANNLPQKLQNDCQCEQQDRHRLPVLVQENLRRRPSCCIGRNNRLELATKQLRGRHEH